MQKAIKILIYFIIGFFLLVFILFVINAFLSPLEKESPVEVQYIEVTGKNGEVQVYIGMQKDSVKILVGKPDKIDIHTSGKKTFENWRYNLNNKYRTDLDIDFENGRLKGLRQN